MQDFTNAGSVGARAGVGAQAGWVAWRDGDHGVIDSAPDRHGRIEQIAIVHDPDNVDLIAAAPDLLAACRELENLVAHTHDTSVARAMVERASAAIAKAEGRHSALRTV